MSTNHHPLTPALLPPELLELILLHLPQKDLLLSQRVARPFRATILGSPRLQKALFLAPDWSPANPKTFSDGSGWAIKKPENNRLLLRAFPGCYPTVTLVIVNDERAAHHSASHSQAHPPSDDPTPSEHWSWDICISFPATTSIPPNTHPAVLYPEASWRRMYLSQPPCQSLHLVRRWQRSVKPAIVREAGIRMGEFVDEAGRSGRGPDGRRDSGVEGVGGEGQAWSQSYISSDRDWHFEGNIRYEDFSSLRTRDAAHEDGARGGGGSLQADEVDAGQDMAGAVLAKAGQRDYLFSRRSRNGIARALSDEWDPGRAYEFGRVDNA